MKVQIIVKPDSEPCERAVAAWRGACAAGGDDLSVLVLGTPEADTAMRGLSLRVLPAAVVDGVLVAVGVQSAPEAVALLTRSRT